MRRSLVLLAVVAVLVAACSGDDDGGRTPFPSTPVTVASTTTAVTSTSEPPTTTSAASVTTTVPDVTTTTAAAGDVADWTILVYLMGDTDLEPFALEDVLEMARVGSTDRVNLVALFDRHPEYSDEGVLNLGDWEDTKLLGIGRGELVELGGDVELNLGSPDTFASFLEVGITSFPAERYGVFLWDHGAGWPGMGPDETDGLDILDMADLRQGLDVGLSAAGVDSIDLLGFDACLMSTFEVASVVAPFADYMLASQELEPGHGWNYEALEILTANPGTSPAELGAAMVDGYRRQAVDSGTSADITLSLLDLGRVDEFHDAFSAVTDPITADAVTYGQAVAGARRDLLGFGRNPDPDLDSDLVDLGGLLDNLAAQGGDLASAAAAARLALDAMVIANATGPAKTGASGLSVYFPELQQYFRQGYLFLEGVPSWPDALAAFYQAGTQIPEDERPRFVETDDGAVYFFDQDGLNVFGPLEQVAIESVIDATIFYGVVDEDGFEYFIGEEPADVFVLDDGTPGVGAIYDLTYLELSDGEDAAVAYLSLTFDPDTGLGLVDIPLQYEAPGATFLEDVVLSVVYDPMDGSILEEDFFTVDEAGTFGPLTADPDGLIYPVVLQVDPDGNYEWITTTDIGLWADLPLIQYEFIPLDPGTPLYVDLTVWDYGGNFDTIVTFPVVP
jgi:hypothetical protein